MLLLALSIAPGIAICFYIYVKDKYNKEPPGLLIKCFFMGVLSAALAVIIEVWGGDILTKWIPERNVAHLLIESFVVVALTEEWCKYFMLKKIAYHNAAFDEPFDGIVYSVMVSMGFATIENVGYVMEYGMGTAVLRMFLSVPAHGAFAILMGYFVGKAKMDNTNENINLIKGLLLATLFHGLFDGFLFLHESETVNKYVSDALLTGGAILSYYIAVRLSFRAIRDHQSISKTNHASRKQN